MFKLIHSIRGTACFRAWVGVVLCAFVLSLPGSASAQPAVSLPAPGMMVNLTTEFTPPLLKGLVVHPENPLHLDFLITPGDADFSPGSRSVKTEEYNKLVKYFLAALTVPEKDLWVNLSPYEKDRMIPQNFGQTEMGRDLLSQDYILKQITASLIYPEKDLGKKFWDRVYRAARARFGTTQIPVNTFNKVWIIPDKAAVYEKDNTVFLVDCHLKVMLEEDYNALEHNRGSKQLGTDRLAKEKVDDVSAVSSQVVREVILPAIEKEVNEGKNFALLRQITNSLVLAAWYKKALQESLLGRVYVDRSKTTGVHQEDPSENQKIYERYLAAFKKGVYNYIKEDVDPVTRKVVPRKYFSGGYTTADTTGKPVGERIARLDPGIPAHARAIQNAFTQTAADGVEKVAVVLNETREGGEMVINQPVSSGADRAMLASDQPGSAARLAILEAMEKEADGYRLSLSLSGQARSLPQLMEAEVRPRYQRFLGDSFDHYWKGVEELLSSRQYPETFLDDIVLKLIPRVITHLESFGLQDRWAALVKAAVWFEGKHDPDSSVAYGDISSETFLYKLAAAAGPEEVEAFQALVEDLIKNNAVNYSASWRILSGAVRNSMPRFRVAGYEAPQTDPESARGIYRIVKTFIAQYGFGTLRSDEERYSPTMTSGLQESSGGASEAILFARNWNHALVELRNHPASWSRLEPMAIWAHEEKVDFSVLTRGLAAVDRYIGKDSDALDVAKKLWALETQSGQPKILDLLNMVADWGREIDTASKTGEDITQLLKAEDYRPLLRELFIKFLSDSFLAEPFVFKGKLLTAETTADMLLNAQEFRDPGNAYQFLEAIAIYQIQQLPFIAGDFQEGRLHGMMRRLTGFAGRDYFTDTDRKTRPASITHKGDRSLQAMMGYLDQKASNSAGRLRVDHSVADRSSAQRFEDAGLEEYFNGLSGNVAVHVTIDETLLKQILAAGAIQSGEANPGIEEYLRRNYGMETNRPTRFVHLFVNQIVPSKIPTNDSLYRRLNNSRYGIAYAPEYLLENYAFLNNPLRAPGDFAVAGYDQGMTSTKVPVKAGILLLPLAEKDKWDKVLGMTPAQQINKVFYYQGKDVKAGLEELKEQAGLKVEGRVSNDIVVSRQPEAVEVVMDQGVDVGRHIGSFKNDYMAELSGMLLSIKDSTMDREAVLVASGRDADARDETADRAMLVSEQPGETPRDFNNELTNLALTYFMESGTSGLAKLQDSLARRGIDYQALADDLTRVAESRVRANIESTKDKPGPVFVRVGEGKALTAYEIDSRNVLNTPYKDLEKFKLIVKMPNLGRELGRNELPPGAELTQLPAALSTGYDIMKNRLGPELTGAIILQKVSLRIATPGNPQGEIKEFPFVFVQEKVETYTNFITRIKDNLKAYGDDPQVAKYLREEIEAFRNEFIQLRRKMAERGVFDADIGNIPNNYGRLVTGNRRVVVVDMDELVYGADSLESIEDIVENFASIALGVDERGRIVDIDENAQAQGLASFYALDESLFEYDPDDFEVLPGEFFANPMHKMWLKYREDFISNQQVGQKTSGQRDGLFAVRMFDQIRARDPFVSDVWNAQKAYLTERIGKTDSAAAADQAMLGQGAEAAAFRDEILSRLANSPAVAQIRADIERRKSAYDETITRGWDNSPPAVKAMIDRYGAAGQEVPSGSGFYGASSVLFLNPTAEMENVINQLKRKIEGTQAFKRGIIKFIPNATIHHTLGNVVKEQAAPVEGPLFRQYVQDIQGALKQVGDFFMYVEGVGIDGHRRKGTLRAYFSDGFGEAEGRIRKDAAGQPRHFSKIDFNFFIVVGELNPVEENELNAVLRDLSQVPVGAKIVNEFHVVHHQDDMLRDNIESIGIKFGAARDAPPAAAADPAMLGQGANIILNQKHPRRLEDFVGYLVRISAIMAQEEQQGSPSETLAAAFAVQENVSPLERDLFTDAFPDVVDFSALQNPEPPPRSRLLSWIAAKIAVPAIIGSSFCVSCSSSATRDTTVAESQEEDLYVLEIRARDGRTFIGHTHNDPRTADSDADIFMHDEFGDFLSSIDTRQGFKEQFEALIQKDESQVLLGHKRQELFYLRDLVKRQPVVLGIEADDETARSLVESQELLYPHYVKFLRSRGFENPEQSAEDIFLIMVGPGLTLSAQGERLKIVGIDGAEELREYTLALFDQIKHLDEEFQNTIADDALMHELFVAPRDITSRYSNEEQERITARIKDPVIRSKMYTLLDRKNQLSEFTHLRDVTMAENIIAHGINVITVGAKHLPGIMKEIEKLEAKDKAKAAASAQPGTPDKAMLGQVKPADTTATFTKGGIDLNPANLNLQIKRDANGIPLPLRMQNVPAINIQGLFPVIIEITPVNLPLLLGWADELKQPAAGRAGKGNADNPSPQRSLGTVPSSSGRETKKQLPGRDPAQVSSLN